MKKAVRDLILGFAGSILGLVLVILFNQYLLMLLPLPARMVSMIPVYWLIALAPFVIKALRGDRLADYGFSAEKLPCQILTGLTIGVLMSLVLTLLPHLAGLGSWVDNGTRYQHPWQFVYEFVYCTAAVGCVEEFVFRGFLYHKLNHLSGETAAILISSALFGLFHLFGGSIAQVVMTALLGAFFCLCRKWFRNCTTFSLILAHGVYDALIAVWLFVFR